MRYCPPLTVFAALAAALLVASPVAAQPDAAQPVAPPPDAADAADAGGGSGEAPESRPAEGGGAGANGPELTAATINRRLDEMVALEISNRPLPEALAEIQRQTGVSFEVPEETYQALPYGRETPINVSVTSTPLRRTIAAIAQRLGLRYEAGEGRVVLRPLPALQRAGRRATVEEVAMLDLLGGVRLDLVEDRPTVAQLLEAVDVKLEEVDEQARAAGRRQPGYVVENRLSEVARDRPVFIPRDATLATALEAIALQSPATWFPERNKIVVLPKDRWVRDVALERPVRLSYDRVDLEQVIDDLERATGLRFRLQPGSLARVEERFRTVRLYLDDATARQALESLGAVTGLAWEVDGDGVYLWHVGDGDDGRRPRTPAAGFRNAELPVLSVDLGDGRTLLVYPSELPREAREALDRRRQDAIEAIVNGRPTTRPATRVD